MKIAATLLVVVAVVLGTAMALKMADGEKEMMMKRGGAMAAVTSPELTVTDKLRNALETKFAAKLRETGRKDARVGKVAKGASEDNAAARRGYPGAGVARPNWLDIDEAGCDDNQNSCKLGLSCQSNICVGPALTGASCDLDVSGYLCETGSFCLCTQPGTTGCFCTAEMDAGAPCDFQEGCTGGSLCNYDMSASPPTGTCMEYSSVEDGGYGFDQIFCEYGLFFDDMNVLDPDNGICTSTPNACTVDADCAPSYSTSSGAFTDNFDDAVFYSCSSAGTCVRDGPDCGGAFRGLLALTRKEKTNSYGADKSLDFTGAFYKVQKCLYQDYVSDDFKGAFPYKRDGLPSQGSFPFFDGGNWDEKKWVARGGDCSASDTRCEIGLTCFSGTCYLPNAEGESCAGDNSNCEVGTFCYNSTTCWPFRKEGEDCHLEWEYNLYYYEAEARCQFGHGCNYHSTTTTGAIVRNDGVCTEYATVKEGVEVSSSQFCAYGLHGSSGEGGGDLGVCRGIADEACDTFRDCDFYPSAYNVADYAGDYDYDYDYFDYDYDNELPNGRDDYGFLSAYHYLEGQVWYCSDNTTSGRCVFNAEENKCEKLFKKYMTYLKGSDSKAQLPDGSSENCALSRCLYDDVTYDKYLPCSGGAAGLLPAPVLLLLVVAIAIVLN